MATPDPTQLKKQHEHSVGTILLSIARVPESSRLLYGASDAKVYDYDSADKKAAPAPFPDQKHTSYITGVALTAENQLVTGGYDCSLIWWDTETKQPLRTIENAHERWIRRVIASPDGALIASIADDMHCHLWDAAAGKKLATLDDHAAMTPDHYPSMLYAVASSPDGKFLATADKTGHIAIWDVATRKKLAALECPVMYTWDPKARRHSIGGIRSVGFSHDGSLLAAGGIGKIGNIDHLGGPSRIEVFDWRAGKRLHEISDDKFKGLVEQITFHPGGEWFIAAGGDHGGFVSVYDVKTGKAIKHEKAPSHVHGFAVNEDYTQLHAACHQKVAQFSLGEA